MREFCGTWRSSAPAQSKCMVPAPPRKHRKNSHMAENSVGSHDRVTDPSLPKNCAYARILGRAAASAPARSKCIDANFELGAPIPADAGSASVANETFASADPASAGIGAQCIAVEGG